MGPTLQLFWVVFEAKGVEFQGKLWYVARLAPYACVQTSAIAPLDEWTTRVATEKQGARLAASHTVAGRVHCTRLHACGGDHPMAVAGSLWADLRGPVGTLNLRSQ